MIAKPVGGFRITVTEMNYETLNKYLIKDLKECLDFALKNTNKIVKTSNKMLYGTLIKIPNEDFVN